MLLLIILIWVLSETSSEVLGSINSYCPHHHLQQFDRKFELKTDRFWKFQEDSNSWVEVQLPYDLLSCRNGSCTKVGQINNRLKKMEKEKCDGFEQTENLKKVKEVEVADKFHVELPLRKRVSLTRISDMSIWITGGSGSIYERFWNGVQWVIAPHDLPISAGPAISIFAVNHSILALSEAGILYQLQLSEGSQPVWVELIPATDQTTGEEDASSIKLLAGVVSHDGMRVYFNTKHGTLLELTELEPPRWIDHGQPRDADVAAIADVASFRTEIVYTVSSVGDLYEYDRSSKPLWKKHVRKDGAAQDFRLMTSPGCYIHSLNGDHSISLFLLTKDGNLVERRLHKRKWKWIVHGKPNDHQLTSVIPALQDESNEKFFSLFLTTSSGFVFEYRTNIYPGNGQEEEIPDAWVNHKHPLNAKTARGIGGLHFQVRRILFALDDGRIGELHLAGLGGENSGPTHHITSRRKSTAKYTWTILDAPESEGWNAEYCTEHRGPTNCVAGTKDDISDQGTRRSATRRPKGSQLHQNYLIPGAADSISEKSSDSFDFLAENWTENSFRLRVLQGGRSFFLITVDGLTFEYLYTGDVWLWLRHESPTPIRGAVGNYNGSLYLVDNYGSLLIRERSSQELAWTNCTVLRRGKQVIGGAPWDKFLGESMKVTIEDALFFISKTGRLLQFTVALRKFKWKNCQNPPDTKVASIVDQEMFRENIVFVIGTNGRLYQYNKVTELWHEHHQSQHLLLSRLPGTATRPSPHSLIGSLFMISQDGGLIEYQWNPWDGWNWVEHGRPYRVVTFTSSPGPCFESNQLFLIGSDGRVYLRYIEQDTWKWRNCGFPHQFDRDGNVDSRDGKVLICVDEELTLEKDLEDVKDNDKNCDPKVASTKPIQFSEDAVIFELRDGRLAEMRQTEDSNWIWSRIIITPTSLCIADYWTALAS